MYSYIGKYFQNCITSSDFKNIFFPKLPTKVKHTTQYKRIIFYPVEYHWIFVLNHQITSHTDTGAVIKFNSQTEVQITISGVWWMDACHGGHAPMPCRPRKYQGHVSSARRQISHPSPQPQPGAFPNKYLPPSAPVGRTHPPTRGPGRIPRPPVGDYSGPRGPPPVARGWNNAAAPRPPPTSRKNLFLASPRSSPFLSPPLRLTRLPPRNLRKDAAGCPRRASD